MAEGGGEQNASVGTPAVFISYASQDAAITDAVVAALERHGLKCWIAPRDVKPGAQYADAIVRAINNAKAVVLVLSANAIVSSHVGREVERAASKHKSIIVFRIDSAPLVPALEYFLSESQWVEAQAGKIDAAYAKLIDAIREPARAAPESLVAVARGTSAGTASAAYLKSRRNVFPLAAGLAIVAVALASLLANRFWLAKRAASERPIATVTPAAAITMPAVSEKSVAVLPFVDMSEKKDQEYFSDGLSEELINMLTKVSDLRVPARTSSFYFKGKSEDIPTIARRLMVAHVLEGSVRRSGTHLRVTAQLVRADNGYHVWSETFDREMDDVFKVQDEIANSVVQALKVRLLPNEKLSATWESEPRLTSQAQLRTQRRLPVKADSYQDYLLGRYYWSKADEQDLKKSIELYRQALAKDPQNALAEAGLAGSYTDLSDWYVPPRAVMPEAKAAAMRALELDESLSAAHSALCLVLANYEWNWSAAERECRRAIELNPNSADAHDNYGVLLSYVGRAQESAAELHRAEELDPLSFRIYSDGALAAFLARDYSVAAEQATRSIELAPDYFVVRGYLALIYVQMGRNDEAVSQAEKGVQLAGSALMKGFLGYTYAATGKAEQARGITDQLIRERARRYVCAYEIGTTLLWLGARDDAFRWFETAYDDRSFCIPTTKFDPRLDPVRLDPRYLSLIRRVGFPDEPTDRGRSTRSRN
jgi:adenylate cyclase